MTGMSDTAEPDPYTEALAPLLPPIAFGNNGRRVTEWQRPTVNPDGSVTVPVVGINGGERITHWSISSTEHGPLVEGAFVPLRAADKSDSDWLYQRAEEAAAAGLPLADALQAVRDGYSSIDVDRAIAAEDDEP